MNIFKSFEGVLRIEATSASVADMLTAINNADITLTDVFAKNNLTVEATVSRKDYGCLQKLLLKRGEEIRVIQKIGVFWGITAMRKRPIFVAGLAVYFLVAMYLPTRVLFVKVEGNNTVTTHAILETVDRIGISFGTSRAKVRSEAVKNALLAAMPELQWAGVNTYGCVAVISVKERTNEVKTETNKGVSSIVAKCDAVIREITVTRGNALCKVGQVVTAGQVLVSGYTDCGITIKATAAEAEVYAETTHRIEAVVPTQYVQRTGKKREVKRYSLILGKNIINLFKDSGISHTSCVKMYEEIYLTLPGGFQLPVALACESLHYYDQVPIQSADICSFPWLEEYSDLYLQSQMVAGKILDRQVSTVFLDNTVYFRADYSCCEMIGQIYNEEIYKGNG